MKQQIVVQFTRDYTNDYTKC